MPNFTQKISLPQRILGCVPVLAAGLFFVFMAAALNAAVREQRQLAVFQQETREVSVSAPESAPYVNQQSIDIAVEIYSIDVPNNMTGPKLDLGLTDRGLTTGDTLGSRKSVTIGPAAFSSWGILGSTLGHEIEIHAKQSFMKVVLLDQLSRIRMASKNLLGASVAQADNNHSAEEHVASGTWRAEREAYQFEMENAERFSLKQSELKSIEQIVKTYYPDRP